MALPILLIFYVSKWKNNKKHWKIGIWRHCDVIIGRGKSKLGVGLLCTEMIIVCKFHDPSIIGCRDTEGGSEEPPPQSQIDQKSPVWIGLVPWCLLHTIFISVWPTWIPLMVGSFCNALERSSIPLRTIKVSATLQDRPGADRCSAFIFFVNPNKPYIFWKLNSSRLWLMPLKISKS